MARVSFFTYAEDPAPGDALTSCSLLSERVLTALREAGVAPSDLETTSIELTEQHRHREEETVPGYRASSNLAVTVRPPSDAGRIIAAAVGAAGTGVGIQNVSFDVDDRKPLTSLARRQAVFNAVSAARELADAAGVGLGRLVELVEGGGGRPPFGRPVRMAAAQAAGLPLQVPPVELGELRVSVSVSAVFEVAGATSA